MGRETSLAWQKAVRNSMALTWRSKPWRQCRQTISVSFV